jgi:hypothetical protein
MRGSEHVELEAVSHSRHAEFLRSESLVQQSEPLRRKKPSNRAIIRQDSLHSDEGKRFPFL